MCFAIAKDMSRSIRDTYIVDEREWINHCHLSQPIRCKQRTQILCNARAKQSKNLSPPRILPIAFSPVHTVFAFRVRNFKWLRNRNAVIFLSSYALFLPSFFIFSVCSHMYCVCESTKANLITCKCETWLNTRIQNANGLKYLCHIQLCLRCSQIS